MTIMKKNIYLAVLLFLTGCQNELYKNPLDDFQSEQGVYIANNSVLQSFVEEGKGNYALPIRMWKLKGCK